MPEEIRPEEIRIVEEFSFHRTGEFRTQTTGDYHCSTLSDVAIRYIVLILADSLGALDARGFLLDQLDCVKYFNQLTLIAESCELLAQRVCHELYELARGGNQHLRIKLMEVTLSPEPFEVKVTKRIRDAAYTLELQHAGLI